ncbi:D-glycero-beta-D-manno-heptose-7-phosphate kinase [Candidatus Woesearchaeota archaeon]|nr:D-glycero-beta-D-manno-heptose-7-phosphate kinase [Candidatus Woesearchaeota archaeon]
MNHLLRVVSSFRNKRVIVIGDVMLDKSIWGSVKRISPEAPVPVVDVKKETYSAGGASNVAMNISALGGKATVVGLVGNDSARNILIKILERQGISTRGMIVHSKRPTTQKVRVLGQNQQLLRVDYESKDYLAEKEEKKIIDFCEKGIKEADSIVVSDYAKGVVTENVMKNIVALCKKNRKPLVIDPKPKHFPFYRGATIITPNTKEACEAARIEETETEKINEVGENLKRMTGSNILITRGERGMSLFSLDGSIRHIPTVAKEVFDVTGAGDTVVGAISLSIAASARLEDAAVIANHAAGITVGKIGTSTVSLEELTRSLNKDEQSNISR